MMKHVSGKTWITEPSFVGVPLTHSSAFLDAAPPPQPLFGPPSYTDNTDDEACVGQNLDNWALICRSPSGAKAGGFLIFFDTTLSSFAFPVLLSKFRNVVQLPKKNQANFYSSSSRPTLRCYQAGAFKYKLKDRWCDSPYYWPRCNFASILSRGTRSGSCLASHPGSSDSEKTFLRDLLKTGTPQNISNSQGLCSVNKHFELFVKNRGIYRNLGQLKEKNHFSVDIFIQIASTLRTAASCIFAHLHHDDIIDYIFKSMYMERCLHWAQ